MYSKIYLRLEPLGLELAAAAARQAGHEVRLMDLQIETHTAYFRLLERWRPEAVGFSLNYLANVPEVLDLVRITRERLPDCFIFAGGHSASFTAEELLRHADGTLDCVLRGEGEASIARLLDAAHDSRALQRVPWRGDA
jgi:magnesium-protoporphyrin IX monomethyl ester (oxidative) cyclase